MIDWKEKTVGDFHMLHVLEGDYVVVYNTKLNEVVRRVYSDEFLEIVRKSKKKLYSEGISQNKEELLDEIARNLMHPFELPKERGAMVPNEEIKTKGKKK